MPRKRSFTKTIDSHHRFHKHPNLVKDTPKPAASNQLCGNDIIYLPTRQGTVYLSLVIDAFSRKIVGPHMHRSLYTTRCLAALQQAVQQAHTAGFVHHSDRGSQYCPDAYQLTLGQAQWRCSTTNGQDYY